MTPPLCTRLSCLDTGPIVAAIKAVSRGEYPDVADACDVEVELAALVTAVREPIAKLVSGTLTRTEALALLGDDPCPTTQRGADDVLRGAT